MTLFLQFNNAPAPPPVDCNDSSPEKISRPFVPSVAPEDMEKAMECGALTPKSVSEIDAKPVPFVERPLTWLDKAKGVKPSEEHAEKHQKLLDEIAFLELMEEQEAHEEMLDEAAQWLEDQDKILWAPESGIPSFQVDYMDIVSQQCIPMQTTQEIRIVRVEPTWSLGSINGVTSVYLPFGSTTNMEGPPGVTQPLLLRKPLKVHEFVLADLEWAPRGRNLWKATKVYPKLPTADMLVSMVETTTTYSSCPRDVTRNGFQYIYEIPCDPANIGSIIGQGGKNINSLIDSIQKERVQKWYGPMPDHIDCENMQFPLPEVTITPIVQDPMEFIVSFTPTKACVRVLVPTCCIWDQKQVDELVGYMHT